MFRGVGEGMRGPGRAVAPVPMFGDQRLRRVVAARRARTAMGRVGVVLAGFVALAALLEDPIAVKALLAAWPIMAIVYGVTRIGSARASIVPHVSIADAGDGRVALFWPAAAIALLAPLTLHYLVALYLEMPRLPNAFLEWIRFGGGLTIPAHLVLVGCCTVFARDRARARAGRSAPSVLRFAIVAVLVTSLAGGLPGLLFAYPLYPPAIVAVTALVFVPATFFALAAIDRDEGIALREHVETPLPGNVERAHELALDEDYSTDTRSRALRFVAEHDDRARSKALLDALVGRTYDPMASEALVVALEQFHRPQFESVRALAPLAPRAVAEILGHYRDHEGAIATLTSLLEQRSVVVRMAAIDSLGRIGGVEQIEVLRALARDGFDRDVARAIERIRRRHARGEAGALSVVDARDRGGHVSLANDKAGGVSLSE